MELSNQLELSYYKTIATINEDHNIYLVQHQASRKIYIKKVLDIYNLDIYNYLYTHPVLGTPTIIGLYEEDCRLIIIETFVSGLTMTEKLQRGDLTLDEIIAYGIDLCEILHQLHTLQPPIIHRDIKPSNIIITDYGRLMLLDFNAAKYFTNAETKDTILLGTQGYAAPEQYGFCSSSPQTDIYSVGILLKELIQSLPTNQTVLDPVIKKCTEMNPSDRYASIDELQDALLKFSPVQVKKTHPGSIRRFLPPGYRTATPWKMLIASMSYVMIFWLCLSLDVKDLSGPALWCDRVFTLCVMLTIVFVSTNYLDIQRLLPLCKHKNKLIHFLGVILLQVLLFFSLFIIYFIISCIFFPPSL